MSKPAVALRTLARKGRTALSAREVTQTQYWVDADWESHDISREAISLIKRLLLTVRDGVRAPRKR